MEDVLARQLISPEVHSDRRVTFRLRAPSAKKVILLGLKDTSPASLSKGTDGIWEVTVGPLAPELYSYVFEVDGTTVVDPHNRHVKRWLSIQSLVEVHGDVPLLHERQDVPHGVVQHRFYHSKTTDSDRGVYVYTPPGYEEQMDRAFPLVVLLHGYGDDESAWVDVGRAPMIADNLLAQARIPALVIAMPYGHPLPLDLQQPFDDYAGENTRRMQRDVTGDLLPMLQEKFRLQAAPHHRAIVGLSMGGGQALAIGLNHPERFAAVGGFSSAAPQGNVADQLPDLATNPKRANEQIDLLWIGCGRDDFLLERNNAFHNWLDQQDIDHAYHLTVGAHEWFVWRKYLADFLQEAFPVQRTGSK